MARNAWLCLREAIIIIGHSGAAQQSKAATKHQHILFNGVIKKRHKSWRIEQWRHEAASMGISGV